MLLRSLLMLCLITIPLVGHAQEEVINLVLNPSFEEDEVILDDPAWQSWATWGDADGLNSTVEIDETEAIDGNRSLKVNPKGVENWHFIVLNLPMIVKTGKTHTASFWAKAEKDRPIAAKLKATDNSVDFCYTDLGLITTEWSEFAFECENPLNSSIKLEFFCAASDVPFWLDFVNLYEGEYVEDILPSELKPPEPVEPAGKLAVQWGAIRLPQ